MAQRPENTPPPRSSIEAEWEELDHSLDDRLDDVSVTAMAAEQVTAPKNAASEDDVVARQLAAFRADQEARGVAIRQERAQQDQERAEQTSPLDRYADGPRHRGSRR